MERRALLSASIREFPISGNSADITAGPDGNLWLTETTSSGSDIGRITPTGVLTEFPLSSYAGAIASGSDGNVWFVTGVTHGGLSMPAIGRITPTGVITDFPVPFPGANPNFDLTDLTPGPDGNVWFTAYIISGGSYVGRMTPAGVVTEYPVAAPSYARPYAITAGPDGNLWLAGIHQGSIDRITPDGAVSEFALPDSLTSSQAIVAGPDGNVWFLESKSSGLGVGRITPGGTIREFPLPSAGLYGDATNIATGPDGNLWATISAMNGVRKPVVRITPTGAVSQYTIPHSSAMTGLAIGPDGDLWLTEYSYSSTHQGEVVQFDFRSSTPGTRNRPRGGGQAHHPAPGSHHRNLAGHSHPRPHRPNPLMA